MTSTTVVRPADPAFREALCLAAVFGLVKLLLTFACTLWSLHLGYGYFRDEFYYIACGRHLAWGYVDHGPIVALQARLGETLFGTSVFAIRIFSALAGGATIALGGILAWALGGRRPAQGLAMTGLLITPQYIGTDGFLSMNSFETVFWMTCLLTLILVLRGHSESKGWIVFGISAGIGLLNKPSITFFLLAVGLGLLCTPQRRLLFTRWAALGIVLLIVIALPNVLWQIHHHWPTLEFLHNGKVENKNIILNPAQFLLAQFLQMHPLNALLWMTGLVSLLRARTLRDARWLGLMYLFFFAMMCALHAKDYYLAPIYPVLYAAGGIAWERRYAASRLVGRDRAFAFPVFESLLFITGLIVLPMAAPVLKPDTWVRYATTLHLVSSNTENTRSSELPQFYADRFGWESYATQVVSAYRSLAPADQRDVCINTENYGEAGALDLLGKRLEPSLPAAISGHNNYWLWGSHGCSGELLIAISGDTPKEVGETFEDVKVVGHMDDRLSMPYEHKNIYLLRHRRPSRAWDWNKRKHYI